ncbi:hypothetical protein G4D82_04855 [Flavobacterium sp. CYK-4]|uniref:phosphoribosyltransferase-like protein n=1 Tax=Flavobacterium lotistagni TaxID=2709660 RepID=UPI00140E3BC3|nr:hypothetical protein [Flavobacterium lotistagni]NHM06541.1 hypothetical protein [Flavobacterium lotistagni]
MDLEQKLHKKIKLLNETLWDGKITYKKVMQWLSNFEDDEKIHALYLLSQCIFFNDFQIKQLLISIYRDFFEYPHIENIRRNNANTLDDTIIQNELKKILNKTRFVIVGNPSESSARLMYDFRTQNKLKKDLFISESEIITSPKEIEHFVFLDDICGSGNQMVSYTKKVIPIINTNFPSAKTYYFLLLGTKEGKEYIRSNTSINIVDSVLELDNSFRIFDSNSRVFKSKPDEIDVGKIHTFTGREGKKLIASIYNRAYSILPSHKRDALSERDKFGYKDGQFLLAFNHNTPDNTLPVIWYNEDDLPWYAIFKRAHKIY